VTSRPCQPSRMVLSASIPPKPPDPIRNTLRDIVPLQSAQPFHSSLRVPVGVSSSPHSARRVLTYTSWSDPCGGSSNPHSTPSVLIPNQAWDGGRSSILHTSSMQTLSGVSSSTHSPSNPLMPSRGREGGRSSALHASPAHHTSFMSRNTRESGPASLSTFGSSSKSCIENPFPDHTILNVDYANSVRDTLRVEYESCASEMNRSLHDSFINLNINVLHSYPKSVISEGVEQPILNMSLAEGLGCLISDHNLSLEEVVCLVRNQTVRDTRPNKRLDPLMIDYLFKDYVHHDLMVNIASYGFDPTFCHPHPIQKECPDNHRSAVSNLTAVTKFIRAGQDDGSMLVLPAELMQRWRNDPDFHFHTSPMGVVPKKNEVTATDGRVILDLSWPRGSSLNDYTIRESIPQTEWFQATVVGRRIHELSVKSGWDPHHPDKTTIHALVGDVNAAFRNIANHPRNVRWFGFFVPELDVIVFDMSAPFGWTASPMFYGVFGNGISALVRRESPQTLNPHLSADSEPFFCYEWVDDYILVELDTSDRLEAAETALRLAMTLTLGPTAIHPKKFSERWEQQVHYLGLDWCLNSCTLSLPRSKIDKALSRVEALLASPTVTKSQLQKLVGSLRHVCTCIPAARPFYQRLQTACRIPRGCKRDITEDLKADAEWFKLILLHGQLESVPVSIFANIMEPDLHLYMDACDSGLVVLNMSIREYILIEFDQFEKEQILRIKARSFLPRHRRSSIPGQFLVQSRQFTTNDKNSKPDSDFSINVREFFSVVLAVLVWGPSWSTRGTPFHVKAWIDNSAAVSWCNKLASPNLLAQQLLRVLGLSLANYRIHLSANHMPGSWNYMADAGSRSSSCPRAKQIWSPFIHSWSQAQVPKEMRHCYQCTSPSSNSQHWPRPRAAATLLPGASGTRGATNTTIPQGCHEPKGPSQPSSLPTRSSSSTTPPHPTRALPSCPRSALSTGVIKPSSATPSACPHAIESPLMAWLAPDQQSVVPNRLARPSYVHTTAPPSGSPTETKPFGAAWYSPSSSAYALANTPAHLQKPTTTSEYRMSPSPTHKATPRVASTMPKRCTYSSGAARETERNEVARDPSSAPATPHAVRSSLRGACEILAVKWASVHSTHSAHTPEPMEHTAMCQSPPSQPQSNEPRQLTASRTTSSHPTLYAVGVPPKCSSAAAATPQCSFSAAGNQTPTKRTFGSTVTGTCKSHQE